MELDFIEMALHAVAVAVLLFIVFIPCFFIWGIIDVVRRDAERAREREVRRDVDRIEHQQMIAESEARFARLHGITVDGRIVDRDDRYMHRDGRVIR